MAGVAIQIDDNLRNQVHALLIEYGLLNDENEMTDEEAEDVFWSQMDKAEKSGISLLSHDEIWASLRKRHAS